MALTKIRSIMDAAGITSEQLGEMAHVPKSTIDKIAGGFSLNPGYTTVAALAKALGCKVDVFADDTDEEMMTPALRSLIRNFNLASPSDREALLRFAEYAARAAARPSPGETHNSIDEGLGSSIENDSLQQCFQEDTPEAEAK